MGIKRKFEFQWVFEQERTHFADHFNMGARADGCVRACTIDSLKLTV